VLATAEIALGLVSIVRTAPQLDVLDCRLSARSVGHDVVKLEEGPLCAAATIVGHEGTLAAVARPHRSPDFSRDVT